MTYIDYCCIVRLLNQIFLLTLWDVEPQIHNSKNLNNFGGIYMIVNFTNHPNSCWCKEQVHAASQWGEIVDLPFPNVPAVADENDIAELADTYCMKIRDLAPDAVLVQGEMSLAFAVVERLCRNGIMVLCTASERVCEVTTADDGSTVRKSTFRFVRFRKYCN